MTNEAMTKECPMTNAQAPKAGTDRLRNCFKKHFHCSSRREEAQKFGSFIRDQSLLTSAATILKHALSLGHWPFVTGHSLVISHWPLVILHRSLVIPQQLP